MKATKRKKEGRRIVSTRPPAPPLPCIKGTLLLIIIMGRIARVAYMRRHTKRDRRRAEERKRLGGLPRRKKGSIGHVALIVSSATAQEHIINTPQLSPPSLRLLPPFVTSGMRTLSLSLYA